MLIKLKIGPTTLPIIADSALAAFPASLFKALANLSSHFFKTRPSSFGVEAETLVPPPPPKILITTRTIVEIIIEIAVNF